MPEFVAAPVERTLDSREYRRDQRPKPPRSSGGREGPKNLHLPVTPGVAEDEAHALDIQA